VTDSSLQRRTVRLISTEAYSDRLISKQAYSDRLISRERYSECYMTSLLVSQLT